MELELSKHKEELNRIMEEKLLEELQVLILRNPLFLFIENFIYCKIHNK